MTAAKFTKTEESICNYTGAFGILISLTCVIQLFIVAPDHWVNGVMLGVYAYIIFCYFFLAFARHSAPILMIFAAFLSLASTFAFIIINRQISYIVIIQYVYCTTIMTFTFVDGLYQRLVMREMERRMEDAVWAGKI